jgi:signal transduction histidine kinase
MLQRDAESPLTGRQRTILDEAEKSCNRLAALVAELSELASLDTGSALLGRETFDLFVLLEEIAAQAQPAATDQPRIAVQGESAGAHITGDRARLRAAFLALLSAVSRERPTAQAITIDRRLERREARSAIVVVGSPAEIEAAYDLPREQLDETRGGLGLALPIAHRVVEHHRGEVWAAATSSAPRGRGAIVIRLPCIGDGRS